MESPEYTRGRIDGRLDERAKIIAFLRTRTHLRDLVSLLEAAMHLKPKVQQNEYCARHNMGPLR